MTPIPSAKTAARLLDWYDRNGRVLPWRARPGASADPYRVWLSEIMLQQTTVATVRSHFERFIERWPTIHDLAKAELDDVLHAWQGLGYYARARNLHRCAGIVSTELKGYFPQDQAGLQRLPGVGVYTAAAVAAIAFGRPATVVDGNVERVVARLFAIETPLPAAKSELRTRAALLTPSERPGDYAQAVMDLGATICSPRQPDCLRCPLIRDCAARAAGDPERLPRRAPKRARPVRRGVAFWLVRSDGHVLLRRRPDRGLLGGMMEVPSTDWRETAWTKAAAVPMAPMPVDWRKLPGLVEHGFTHFKLELTVLAGRVDEREIHFDGAVWAPLGKLDEFALPTLMKKVVEHALAKTRRSRLVRRDNGR